MEEFTGFNGEALGLVRDVNIPEARKMLDRILTLVNPRAALLAKQTLGSSQQPIIDKVRSAVKNIFSIYLDADMQPMDDIFAANLNTLRANVQKVRTSFDAFFKKVYVDRNAIFVAWASNNFTDTSIYFSPRYFDELGPLDQAVTLVHERSHTALKLPGHPGTGDSPVCIIPHEGKKIGFDQAIRNAYCYEWLALSLHPNYNPQPFRDACAANSITGHATP